MSGASYALRGLCGDGNSEGFDATADSLGVLDGRAHGPIAAARRSVAVRFAADPHDGLLRTHKLKGELDGYWAFSVDDDLRVLFRWDGDTCFLVNLGTHHEVY